MSREHRFGRARRGRGSTWRVSAAALAFAIVSGSCAPPPPAPLDAASIRSRYDRALEARARAARSLEAELALWPALAGRRLPGALATLMIAAPDRCRLRVQSPGGTVLEAIGAGDSLRLWLPGERRVADLTACADSAALGDLPGLVVRIAAALWSAPEAASAPLVSEGGVTRLAWSEGDRRVRVSLTREGVPDTVAIASERGAGIHIVYSEWMRSGDVSLPREFRVTEDGARGSLRCRVSRLRVRSAAESSWFAGPGPRGASREAGCDAWRSLGVGVGAEP